MHIRYDIDKLSSIARDLYEVLHLSVLIIDNKGNKLVECDNPCDFCSVIQSRDESWHRGCHESDMALIGECKRTGRAAMHICHMNLCDVALPIIKDDKEVAYVMLGRMRSAECNTPREDIGGDLCDLYYALPYFSERELESLKSLISTILFGGAITFDEPDLIDSVKEYIDENISGELSVGKICKRFFISKNTLYKMFHETVGCTVGEFISQRRIEAAKLHLVRTNMTVMSIGAELGFESYAYFCRFFKSRTNMTPSEYRSSHR